MTDSSFDLHHPGLPAGFADTFTSSRVAAGVGDVTFHTVQGGDGPPVLLVPGWPQSWFAWRLMMPALVDAGHRVIAVDLKGSGLSDRPDTDDAGTGYDTGTAGTELVELMRVLGHDRFDLVGHDVGMWIAHAIAADHPASVARLAVTEAMIPGLLPAPSLFLPQAVVPNLWHFVFNRAPRSIQEQLFANGGEEAFVAWQFRTKAATPDALSDETIAEHWRANSQPGRLGHHALNYYRAIDATVAQSERRREIQLPMPVLAVGGQQSLGELVAMSLQSVSTNVQGVSIPGAGHYVPEEAPHAFLDVLLPFLATPEQGVR